MLSEAAERNQIPPEILMAIAFKESNWRHYNRDGSVLRGQWTPSDVGIMQINEKAHPAAFPRARTDMRYNIEYGARYLKWQFERYGNWEEAVAAYNSGSVVRRKNGKLINHNYYDTVNRFAKDFMREPYEMPRT
ncbi:MAG: lytic transglycosylase domain-containing protein [Candidatus Sericytochromatia bacterium]|uniref:Lytic transglycosylase domain-containing protein n=1 Tax=Candidatus Tanganyikabacteria bacterium TaxID=2961651 RepID=A0A937X4C8_9BACT|nr:lytic transglycosylase domain-containing protein [Candidatus Tanganyikabacteria bacterium]